MKRKRYWKSKAVETEYTNDMKTEFLSVVEDWERAPVDFMAAIEAEVMKSLVTGGRNDGRCEKLGLSKVDVSRSPVITYG